MRAIGKVWHVQGYGRCGAGERSLEAGDQWPRLMPRVLELCLLCSTESTLAGQQGRLFGSPAGAVVASHDKQKSLSQGKECLTRLSLKCFEGLH